MSVTQHMVLTSYSRSCDAGAIHGTTSVSTGFILRIEAEQTKAGQKAIAKSISTALVRAGHGKSVLVHGFYE